MQFTHPASSLRRALTDASVKGRSAAKTRAEMERLCAQHGLLGLTLDDNKVVLALAVPELPDDVLNIVCMRVASTTVEQLIALCEANRRAKEGYQPDARVLKAAETTTRTLMSMCCSSRMFYETLEPNAEPWSKLLHVFVMCSNLHAREAHMAQDLVNKGKLTPKRALELVVCTGCELCRAKGIRKVHWPFKVRCCQECLYSCTISTYRLTTDFSITDKQLRYLPKTEAMMYRPGVGSFSCHFVWTDDAVTALSEHYGMSFAKLRDAYEYVQRLKDEEEARKAEAERIRTEPVRNATKALLVGWPDEDVDAMLQKEPIKNTTRVNVVARNLASHIAMSLLRKRATATLPSVLVERVISGGILDLSIVSSNKAEQIAYSVTDYSSICGVDWSEKMPRLLSNAITDAEVEEVVWPSFVSKLKAVADEVQTRRAAKAAKAVAEARIAEAAEIKRLRKAEATKEFLAPATGWKDCPHCSRKMLKGDVGLRHHLRDKHGIS